MSGRQWAVPASAEQTHCTKCHAAIYFVRTPKGAQMPVDCNGSNGREPALGMDGVGVSHFETCPHANFYSGRNRS